MIFNVKITDFLKKLLLLCSFLTVFFACNKTPEKISAPIKPVPKIIKKFGYILNDYNVINDTIQKGESFGIILDRHHVFYPTINKIAATVKKKFDVRRIRAGKPYTILAAKDSTEKAKVFIYKHNKIEATILDFSDSIITASTYKKPIEVVEKEVIGKISSSLSEAMDSLGLRPNLTNTIADIYSWTLDFYKLQKGDEFKFVYEEKFINDSISVGYGNIKAVVFKHKETNLYAFRYLADSVKGITEYYDDEGNLLRRQFLKSPIKFQYRISSRYNLKRRIAYYGNRVRPHRGTDFAAKVGTPIMATASGTVVESRRKGGNGNYVKVKHNKTYSTQYLHMKRRKVKVGQYVQQGDVLGWVGMTGNTGGPHVCYRFWKNGREVDPFKQKLPPAKPLRKEVKKRYLEFIKPLQNQLDGIQIIQEAPTQLVAEN